MCTVHPVPGDGLVVEELFTRLLLRLEVGRMLRKTPDAYLIDICYVELQNVLHGGRAGDIFAIKIITLFLQ